MGIGCPEIRPSGMPTAVTIIPELGSWKEEAGTVQGVMARQNKRRTLALSEDDIFNLFHLGILIELSKMSRYMVITCLPLCISKPKGATCGQLKRTSRINKSHLVT
jgi:hypothetical protein